MKEIVESIFKEKFGTGMNPLIVRSPGRVNIIGEHTDYNNGFVLPAAIDKAAWLAVALRNDNEIHLVAHDLNETFCSSTDALKPVGAISWPNFILGAAAQFVKKGIPIKGFNAVLLSDIPIGAGLSSSAAIECATVFILDNLLGTRLDKIDMAKMAQQAEHEYAGVFCGIMDQFASLMGKKDHVLKLDCRSLAFTYIPFKLEGIKILLFNTNVKHSLASSEYNTRRKECAQGVSWINELEPQVHSLRDANKQMLKKLVLPKSDLVYKRCLFVVEEIERLQNGCKDLQEGNLAMLGKRMFETHEGLSAQYEVSCKELDLLISYVKNNDQVLGARMMGGGFGGCTINLVKEEAIADLIQVIKPAYESATNLPFTYYIASIENGTEII